MKLDSWVLGCLRGIGGATLALAAGCASAPEPAVQSTTPVAVADPPAQDPGTAQTPGVTQTPDGPQPGDSNYNMMAACGRG